MAIEYLKYLNFKAVYSMEINYKANIILIILINNS